MNMIIHPESTLHYPQPHNPLPPKKTIVTSQVDGMNVTIHVKRLWSRYIVSALLPILATTWLVSQVFCLNSISNPIASSFRFIPDFKFEKGN